MTSWMSIPWSPRPFDAGHEGALGCDANASAETHCLGVDQYAAQQAQTVSTEFPAEMTLPILVTSMSSGHSEAVVNQAMCLSSLFQVLPAVHRWDSDDCPGCFQFSTDFGGLLRPLVSTRHDLILVAPFFLVSASVGKDTQLMRWVGRTGNRLAAHVCLLEQQAGCHLEHMHSYTI